jgi:Ca-activated chloride channel family protein
MPWAAIVLAAWSTALAAFGVALAGPHIIAPVVVRDGAIALCIDTSGSMSADDITPTRAAAAAAAARAFIDALPSGTRIAIVTFSSSAALILAPTADKDAARAALDRIPPPNGGTAIGDALEVAGRSLPPVAHRAVVLVTDGVNNLGVDPQAAAQQIGAAGIGIWTVGIGTHDSGAIIPGTDQEADLDEDALRAIAAAGHGEYARAGDAQSLRAHLAQLAQQTTIERRRVDASLAVALIGGAIMVIAGAGAFFAGRIP